MKSATVIIIMLLSVSSQASSEKKNNKISGFKFVSCSTSECIELSAPAAWVSLLGGSFTTEGETSFRVFDRSGNFKSEYVGESASYSAAIDTITVEKSDSAFALYALKDGKLSVYGPSKMNEAPK